MTVLVIGGPTGAGKSALAVQIAESFGGIVLSADAMTVYKGLDVGTAKPGPELQRRVPHLGVDLRQLWEDFTVADFVGVARRAVNDGQRLIVAGGTPFYLRALVRPLAPLPAADPALRAALEALPDPHAALARVDPASAARLHPRDRVRVVRALEVHTLTGIPLSVHHAVQDTAPPVDARVVWIDRDDLRERIQARLQGMVDAGYIDEVRALWARGVDPTWKPLRSFAYVHLLQWAGGQLPLDEALRRTERDTWLLARKQRTWARGMGWAPAADGAAWAAAEALWGPRPAAGGPPPA